MKQSNILIEESISAAFAFSQYSCRKICQFNHKAVSIRFVVLILHSVTSCHGKRKYITLAFNGTFSNSEIRQTAVPGTCFIRSPCNPCFDYFPRNFKFFLSASHRRFHVAFYNELARPGEMPSITFAISRNFPQQN